MLTCACVALGANGEADIETAAFEADPDQDVNEVVRLALIALEAPPEITAELFTFDAHRELFVYATPQVSLMLKIREHQNA